MFEQTQISQDQSLFSEENWHALVGFLLLLFFTAIWAPTDPGAISIAFEEESRKGNEVCKAIEQKLKDHNVSVQLFLVVVLFRAQQVPQQANKKMTEHLNINQ